jgi:hypothetical protein
VRFVLLVEGATEKDSAASFLKRWLDPQLKQPVGIQVVPYKGYAEWAHKFAARTRMHLEGPKQAEIIAVIGLLDLYGPDFYPSHLGTVNEKYVWGVEHFQREAGRDRFRMFFAVHEFEAWLLSQPDIFPREVGDVLRGKIDPPEMVNFNEPPAKMLDKVYKQRTKRNYKKTTYGTQLFAKLDPSIAVKKCPYLKAMLDEMLSLARAVGL